MGRRAAPFWERVSFGGKCWEWRGCILTTGYGQVVVDGKQVLAHRYAYEQVHGPIPRGLVVDHLCRVRSCVNPWHMEAVTPRENILRGVGPTATNATKTHCPQGHGYTTENTRHTKRGRFCRSCDHIHYMSQRAAGTR